MQRSHAALSQFHYLLPVPRSNYGIVKYHLLSQLHAGLLSPLSVHGGQGTHLWPQLKPCSRDGKEGSSLLLLFSTLDF